MNAKKTAAAIARLGRLEGFLEQDPDNASLQADLFQTALAAGRFDVASRLVSAALGRDPSDAGWEHRRAQRCMAERQFAEAQRILEGLLARELRAPAVVHDLAFTRLAQGAADEAARFVEPLLVLAGGDGAAAWSLWLRCQHHLLRVAPALDAFRRRLEQGPVSAEALGIASLMALDVGDRETAAGWSDAALREEDQLEALVTRGSLAHLASDPQAAIGWYERALELSPADGRTWSGLALSKMMLEDLGAADRAFARAVETMPDHVGTWIGWGWCHLAEKRLEDALRTFERALELDRNFAEGHGCLALALVCSGRREEAQRHCELALRLDPEGLTGRYAQAVLAGKAADQAVMSELTRAAARRFR